MPPSPAHLVAFLPRPRRPSSLPGLRSWPPCPAPHRLPTLGDATEELERHGQADQVFEQWDPDALQALFVLLLKPAAAAEDALVHHVCGRAL